MADPTTAEVMTAVGELRSIIDSGNEKSAENLEKLDKINATLDKQEAANQKLTQEIEEQKKTETELTEKLADIEKQLYRQGNGKGGENEELKRKRNAFESLIVKGFDAMTPEERKDLRTDSDPDGGFLVHPEYAQDILKNITEVSPIRSVARVRRTSSKSIIIPRRTGLVNGGWAGEREQNKQDNSTYGDEEIFVNKLSVDCVITVEMLQDSAFAMESEITQDVSEDFAQIEGMAFVKGDGVKKPEGFVNNTNLQTVNSGVADNISGDGIIDLAGELKTGYNAVYGANRRTIAAIRKLKDGDEQYLWQPGLSGGLPNTLNGSPYIEVPDLDDIAADSISIVYGDFGRGYTIVDSVNMTVIRDQYSLASFGKVKFVFMRRVGGQVVLPEAIKLLKCAA